MIISTTNILEGRTVKEYKGVIASEAIVGANIFKDVFDSIRDIVGGRSAAYEQELKRARTLATEELIEQAKEKGANAIIGLDIDYETVGGSSSMLMVSMSGTAVIVE
jgi:uncharacterized protein YbjQ (UPF0145 family)